MATAPYTNAAVIIHGPQGCGKTRHSATLARHYGKVFILNHDDVIQPDAYPMDAIVFTNTELPGAIAFDTAMRAAGLTSSTMVLA
jgi:uridine kinase